MLMTALWNVSTQFEAKLLHGLPPTEQRTQSLQLIATGFRPVAIAVTSANRREEGKP